MTERIYFDNSATTKICDAALERYIEISRECYGNPSSLHSLGFDAERILTSARDTVRASLGAKDSDVIFTASGSEANNLAIIGRALSKERYRSFGKILITEGEHASVGECANLLCSLGFNVAKIATLYEASLHQNLARRGYDHTLLAQDRRAEGCRCAPR